MAFHHLHISSVIGGGVVCIFIRVSKAVRGKAVKLRQLRARSTVNWHAGRVLDTDIAELYSAGRWRASCSELPR